MNVCASIVCPSGGLMPTSPEFEDLLDLAMRNAKAGKPCAVVMVLHPDDGTARAALDAAAWSLERTL